jgi:hypothetical protein
MSAIRLDSITRDENGDVWDVELSVRFRDLGFKKYGLRVNQTIDHKEFPIRKRSMQDAADEAHRIVVTDLLRMVIANSEWLPEQTRGRITSAFPQVHQTENGSQPSSDADAQHHSE